MYLLFINVIASREKVCGVEVGDGNDVEDSLVEKDSEKRENHNVNSNVETEV